MITKTFKDELIVHLNLDFNYLSIATNYSWPKGQGRIGHCVGLINFWDANFLNPYSRANTAKTWRTYSWTWEGNHPAQWTGCTTAIGSFPSHTSTPNAWIGESYRISRHTCNTPYLTWGTGIWCSLSIRLFAWFWIHPLAVTSIGTTGMTEFIVPTVRMTRSRLRRI